MKKFIKTHLIFFFKISFSDKNIYKIVFNFSFLY